MIADGTLPSANDYFVSPIDFWEDTFGWGAAEIEDHRQDALGFFDAQFGIDAEQVMADGRGLFFPFQVSSGADYRVVGVSAEVLSDEGWRMTDTGWILTITDPNGFVVPDGPFAGALMTPGSVVVFGQYYIEPTGIPRNCGRSYRPRAETITYSSGCPIIPDFMGIVTFICDLHHPDYGPGKATGVTLPTFNGDGTYEPRTRNFLTFPPTRMD